MSDELLDVLDEGRELMLSRMTEQVRIGRLVTVTNPQTLRPEETLAQVEYTGIAQIKYDSDTVAPRLDAGQVTGVQTPILKVPTDTVLLERGRTVECDASTADSRLVGRRFTIDGRPEGGQTTAHRYPLKEIS